MKKLLGFLVILLFLFSSCEEEITTGTVIVRNYTSSAIVVDVNDGNGNWLGERTLYSGSSTSYTAEAGSIDGAARFVDGIEWFYTSGNLSAESTLYFDWSPYRKSTDINGSGCFMDGDGSLVKISIK